VKTRRSFLYDILLWLTAGAMMYLAARAAVMSMAIYTGPLRVLLVSLAAVVVILMTSLLWEMVRPND